MKQFIEFLEGKKTYFTVVVALVLLCGQWAHKWTLPNEVYGVLAAVAMAFLRHGLATSTDADDGKSPMANGKGGASGGGAALAGVLLLFGIGCLAMAVAIGGCMTSRVVTITPGGTNATTGSITGPATNTVTIVNTNNLQLDCLAIQGLAAGATVGARLADTNTIPYLQDAQTAMGGLLNGASEGSTAQILDALGQSGNTNLATAFAPVVAAASSIEQGLLAKYDTSVAGQISVAITRAVYNGISLGLAGTAP